MPNKVKRVVNINVLPGEKLDGSGRVCIHLFVRDEQGSFVEPHVLHHATDEHGEIIKGQLVAKPTRGRLACDAQRKPKPTKSNTITVLPRSDDPRAVTCPKCIASNYYREMMSKFDKGE